MSVSVFGIRHHGPGSARSVRAALEALAPDAVLIEGPPDADALIPLAAHADMRPPVAILIYSPDEPKHAVYYPFAKFSPEWQAIQYAARNAVPARFIDLPQAYQFALDKKQDNKADLDSDDIQAAPKHDPFGWIAEAAGYSDGELWWEQMIEQRLDSHDLFLGVAELMSALRAETPEPANQTEALREAYMRQSIRRAQKEGFERIAVVCGAWHAPALIEMPAAKSDAALLKALQKVKVSTTWTPWTYRHLTYASGYGAGIQSPGYYQHIWEKPEGIATGWMTRVAMLLREQDIDASPASIIEAVRLAESLTAVRNRRMPGLVELNDATRAVLCFGSDTPLRLISEKLIVGEVLGLVPEETPSLPLQQDIVQTQKRLRLLPEANERILDLDQRKGIDLERSHMLHRLNLLNIRWGRPERATGKGTFHEIWRLRWDPGFSIAVIEANIWGNTLAAAASNFAIDRAERTQELAGITGLLEVVLLSNLPDAMTGVMARLETVAALSSDIPHAMDAVPPLANILRYGNVRQTDTDLVKQIVDGLITRIAIGLPNAAASLNDDAAEEMYTRISSVNSAIQTLQNEEYRATWHEVVNRLADQQQLNGLLAGGCCRLLLDQELLSSTEVARRLALALSHAVAPADAGRWIEGFLRGSGLVLLHNTHLWEILDTWLISLTPETFVELLPLLRRTFATFAPPERRQMGEQAARGASKERTPGLTQGQAESNIDVDRARRVLPIAALLLGLRSSPGETGDREKARTDARE